MHTNTDPNTLQHTCTHRGEITASPATYMQGREEGEADYRKEAIISASLSVFAIPRLYPLRLPRLVRTPRWCRAGERCFPPPRPRSPREIRPPGTHMVASNTIHKS
ncbi:hypothetical protein E2C01_022194 [Portunus trituberculatus]|uniref:Uncharacterized protein n=1 Tax=Portunus trituberculatus TaxID=210409 RepID=A0A5B7E5C6_PORTR|nr:hypothetical protein [Portunus trituberculatus]